MLQVTAEQVQVLNSVRAKLPFLVTSADDAKDSIKEEIRLRYRCLDLRRPQMSSNIMLRHQVVKVIRRYLEDVHGFVETETPILSRSNLEGARDYLVPSRVQPGTFYALPQSPQFFKQMLMVSGFDKYYQIARKGCEENLKEEEGYERPNEGALVQEQVIDELDRAVVTVKKGEVDVLTIAPEYAFGL